jgi:glycosyltransferase involved in cell wall biosynthesis
MRVVLFIHEYPPFLFGGVGIFVKELAHGLANMGVDVTVISGRPVPWKSEQSSILDNSQDKITTIRLQYPNLPPRHTTFQVVNNTKVKKILECIKPDIIHGQSGVSFPAMVSLKKIAPFIVTFHTSPLKNKVLSLDSIGKGGTFGDFFNGVIGYPFWESGYRLEYENANARVAVSESLMNQLSDEMNVKDGAFEYIRNGVDLKHLDELSLNSFAENRATDKPFLLFGGRLFWSKGVMRLLDLAYLLEKKYHLDLKIVIYGSGPLDKRIIQRKEMYGLNNVILKQFSSRPDFLLEMMNAMCVLIPSPFEAAPMVLLESMCLGKVPVMFNLPYAREFTENGKYGILCDNIQDMALKIKEFYDSGSASNFEMQIRSFARQNYNIEKTAMAYYELYKRVAN